MEEDDSSTVKTEPTDSSYEMASGSLRRSSSRQSLPTPSSTAVLLTASSALSMMGKGSNAGRATSARRTSSSTVLKSVEVAQPKLTSPIQNAASATSVRPSALSQVLPRGKPVAAISLNNGALSSTVNHSKIVRKSAPSAIETASAQSAHIRMGFCGPFTVLINTLIPDKSKAVCGIVYSAQVGLEEYMCNFCHYRVNKLATFGNHVSTHVFQCNHCTYKSFSCLDFATHKKESHPDCAHELVAFERAQATAASSPVINNGTLRKSNNALINALTSPAIMPKVSKSIDNGTSAFNAASEEVAVSACNKQYFTFRVHEDKNGYIMSLECELCVFKTTTMGGLMSHSTTHKGHEVNRNDNIAVWQCLYCQFASRRKKQVVTHILHAHREQSGGEVRMRKGVWAQVTQTMSMSHDGQHEGEWLWGCYYCTVNSTDRELVLAHESLEHSDLKLMITRKKLNEADKMFWGISTEFPGSRKDNRSVPKRDVLASNNGPTSLLPDLATTNTDTDAPSPSSVTKATSRRKQPLPRRVVDDDGLNDSAEMSQADQSNNASDAYVDAATPSADRKEFVGVMVLDHIADDLKVDATGYMQYDALSNKGNCMSCNFHTVGPQVLLEEHVLQSHILVDLWKCAYCNFKNVRHFGVVRHVKLRHRDLPEVILRRKPFSKDQPISLGRTERNYEIIGHVSRENFGVDVVLDTIREFWKKRGVDGGIGSRLSAAELSTSSVNAAATASGSSSLLKFSGPMSVREKQLLGLAKKAWACPHCARRSVLQSYIFTHIRSAHPEQPLPDALQTVDRHLDDESSMDEGEGDSECDVKLLHGRIVLSHCNYSENDGDTVDMDENSHFATCPSDFAPETLAELGIEVELPQPSLMQVELTNDVVASVCSDGPSTSENAVNKSAPQSSTLLGLAPWFGKYKCAYCNEFHQQASYVREHLKENHLDVEPKVQVPQQYPSNREKFLYTCPLLTCSFVTTVKRSLHSHLVEFPAHTGYLESSDVAPESVETPLVSEERAKVDAENTVGDSNSVQMTREKRKCPPGWVEEILTKRRSVDAKKSVAQRTLSEGAVKQEECVAGEESQCGRAEAAATPSHLLGAIVLTQEVHLRCYHCKHETHSLNEMKEHLTSAHPLKELVAMDLSGKKQRKVYICPLLFCNACFTGNVLFHRHMRAHNVELATITAARHMEAAATSSTATLPARNTVNGGSDNDNASAGESEPSTMTLADRKALLRSRRQENAEKLGSGAYCAATRTVNILCPYCSLQCDSLIAMKVHLSAMHAANPAVCHDVTRLSAWNKNYRIILCTKPECNFYCYSSTDVVEEHKCKAALSLLKQELTRQDDSVNMECVSKLADNVHSAAEQEVENGDSVSNRFAATKDEEIIGDVPKNSAADASVGVAIGITEVVPSDN